MLNRLKSFVSEKTEGSERPAPSPSSSFIKSSASSISTPTTFSTPLPKASIYNDLKAQVPLADECESCELVGEGEDEEHHYPSFPKKFDMDCESEMLGTTKPMHRLALISSSVTDWPHDIASDQASLAFHLGTVKQSKATAKSIDQPTPEIPGVYSTDSASKLSVLASSVEPSDHSEGKTSVLVFPDFKLIDHVPVNKVGAQGLYDHALSPEVGLSGGETNSQGLKSWVLPYKAVVLLCSHKARDKRCHIAAPLLEQVITSTLSTHGYTVDIKGDSLHDLAEADQLENLEGGDEEVRRLLKEVAGADQPNGQSKEVGVFKISHLGGHRYAGVMIICFPSGAILYYGRVTPKKCVDVVEKTILKGQVLPEHLRGGANLRRTEGLSLLDW